MHPVTLASPEELANAAASPGGKRLLRTWQEIVFGALGIALLWLLFWPPIWGRVRHGDTDFQHFYVGAKLVFQGKLYDTPAFLDTERRLLGHSNPEILATRPPFLSVLLWPLAQLSYGIALLLWTALLAGATLSFIWLWPDRHAAALICCWSAGLSAAFANAQDLPLILLWLAIAVRFRERRHFLSGLVLSLCATKFHIFVFLPLLVWRHRMWKGFLCGAAALAAMSFWAAGWDWPRQYAATLASAQVHPVPQIMPNLHGFFSGLPHSGIWEIVTSVLVAVAVLAVVRRANFEVALASVLTGGLLVSYHAYLHDCTLLVPVILIILPAMRGWSMIPVIWLLVPLSGLALLSGHWAGDITRLAIVALLIMLVHTTSRMRHFR